MKTRTNVLISVGVPLTVAILTVVGWIHISLHGELITRIAFSHRAKAYVAETYPGRVFGVEFARYDFKTGGYFCIVNDPASEDGCFTVYKRDGITDDYAHRVEGRENTLWRLQSALDSDVEAVMAANYPHRCTLILADLDWETMPEDRSFLTLDMPYSRETFPLPVTLALWTEDDGDGIPTWEDEAARLRELAAFAREKFPCVTKLSLRLQSRYTDAEGELTPETEEEINAYDVPLEVIESDGLEAYLEEVRAAQEAEEAAIAAGEEVKDGEGK